MLWPRRRAVSRAASASIPARRETIATLASPSAASSASLDLLGGSTGRRADDAADARAQLLVRRGDVDHEVAERLAQPDHRERRERVEDELLGRSRLQPRRAGEELRARRRPRSRGRRLRRAPSRGPRRRTRSALPLRRPLRCAPSTYGVRPLALTPTTKSSARGSRAAMSRCTGVDDRLRRLPARAATRQGRRRRARRRFPGGIEKVDSHSEASSAAMRPDEPAPT